MPYSAGALGDGLNGLRLSPEQYRNGFHLNKHYSNNTRLLKKNLQHGVNQFSSLCLDVNVCGYCDVYSICVALAQCLAISCQSRLPPAL